MYPLIVSPPFGTYVRDSRVTPVLGTFTINERPGRAVKAAQFVYDNIRHPVHQGWRNRIGLRNPGINSLPCLDDRFIYSIAGIKEHDWHALYIALERKLVIGGPKARLEINLGCRNVREYTIKEGILRLFCRDFIVSAKLPASKDAIALAEMCASAGVGYLHVGNTFSDGRGSISGKPLKAINLPLVEEISRRIPGVPIIGGGGIYEWQDLLDYWTAGANLFSLGTVWFRPWRAKEIITKFQSWDGLFEKVRNENFCIIK